MIIRISPQTAWLNSRLIHFPQGDTARNVYARLARFTIRDAGAPTPAKERQKVRVPGELFHPFARLADAIIHRLENPKLRASQRDATPRHARGSNGKRKVVISYTPAEGNASVSFNGHTARTLSETDRAEVRGAISLALLSAPTDPRTLCHALGLAYRSELPGASLALAPSAELQKHGACFPCRAMLGLIPLSFAHWKQCFTAARATLGMKRKTAREDLSESLEALQETDFHSGLLEDQSARAHREAEAAREAQEFSDTRARLAREARRLHALCQTAFRAQCASGARRRVANFRGALSHLRRALHATLGSGHAHGLCRTAAYEQDRAFRAYLAQGETRLAQEVAEARAEREAEENARMMHAACNW